MAAEHEMSAAAAARMDAMLPEMLAALRGRVRRARRRRAAVVVAALATPVLLVTWLTAPGHISPRREPVAAVAAPAWSQVHDDPQVLARCEVADVARAAWFAGDDELQALLRDADKPAGLVRVGDRVFVSAAAIDPWPGESP